MIKSPLGDVPAFGKLHLTTTDLGMEQIGMGVIRSIPKSVVVMAETMPGFIDLFQTELNKSHTS